MRLLYWAPRVGGIVMAGFLAVFALDAFASGPASERVPELGRHLVPALTVAACVMLAWRFERLGATALLLIALGYAWRVNWRIDWITVIAGPLVLLAVLFLASATWARRSGR